LISQPDYPLSDARLGQGLVVPKSGTRMAGQRGVSRSVWQSAGDSLRLLAITDPILAKHWFSVVLKEKFVSLRARFGVVSELKQSN